MWVLWVKLYAFPPSFYSFRGLKKKNPDHLSGITTDIITPAFTTFLYPDFTVGFGISPNLLSVFTPPSDYTAGRELHPAPKSIYCKILCMMGSLAASHQDRM